MTENVKIALSRNGEESFKNILDPDGYPDHPQNLITFKLAHFGPILKILSISIHNFLSYVVNKQTNKQMNR